MKKIKKSKPCCTYAWESAIEAAATLADELGTWGYENGCPHTERDGYGLANRIRALKRCDAACQTPEDTTRGRR